MFVKKVRTYFLDCLEDLKIFSDTMTSKGLDQKEKPSKSPNLNGNLPLLIDICIQRSSNSLNQIIKKHQTYYSPKKEDIILGAFINQCRGNTSFQGRLLIRGQHYRGKKLILLPHSPHACGQ